MDVRGIILVLCLGHWVIVDLELLLAWFFKKKFIHVYALDANFSEDRNQELIVCILSPLCAFVSVSIRSLTVKCIRSANDLAKRFAHSNISVIFWNAHRALLRYSMWFPWFPMWLPWVSLMVFFPLLWSFSWLFLLLSVPQIFVSGLHSLMANFPSSFSRDDFTSSHGFNNIHRVFQIDIYSSDFSPML